VYSVGHMESDKVTKVDTKNSDEAFRVQKKTLDITPERDKGVLKEIIRQGKGDGHPLKGDTVYLHYVGRLQDGTEFETSRKGSGKFQFVLDSENGISVMLIVVYFTNKCFYSFY